MARLVFRGGVGVLLAALGSGCLGGQTGQPSSGTCDRDSVPASATWGGTTVGAAAKAFDGPYEAPLLWQTGMSSAEQLRLTIAHDAGSILRNCVNQLHVPVTVNVTTSESGISESGDATLELSISSDTVTGTLKYESERLVLTATLTQVSSGVALKGDLDALDPKLPGTSASFAVEP